MRESQQEDSEYINVVASLIYEQAANVQQRTITYIKYITKPLVAVQTPIFCTRTVRNSPQIKARGAKLILT
jgi:hypothetical protein